MSGSKLWQAAGVWTLVFVWGASAGGQATQPAATASPEERDWALLEKLLAAPPAKADDEATYLRHYVAQHERILEMATRFVADYPASPRAVTARLVAAGAHLALAWAVPVRAGVGLPEDPREHLPAARRLVEEVQRSNPPPDTQAEAELQMVHVRAAEASARGTGADEVARQVELPGLKAVVARFPQAPVAPEILVRIGDIYEALGESANAAATYTAITQQYPATASAGEAWFRLGLGYRAAGQSAQAQAAFRQVVAIIPKTDTGRAAAGFLKRDSLVGQALELTLPGLDGRPIALAQWRGKVVLMVIWSTRCEASMAALDALKRLYSQLQPQGLEIVAVSFDAAVQELTDTIRQRQLPWRHAHVPEGFASDFALDHGIDYTPQYWLLDRQGIVRSLDLREDMEGQIRAWLAR